MTEAQGQMGELIAHIAHPAPVLAQSNAQHAQLVRLLEEGDAWAPRGRPRAPAWHGEDPGRTAPLIKALARARECEKAA